MSGDRNLHSSDGSLQLLCHIALLFAGSTLARGLAFSRGITVDHKFFVTILFPLDPIPDSRHVISLRDDSVASNRTKTCSGVIIRNDLVLTSANCFFVNDKNYADRKGVHNQIFVCKGNFHGWGTFSEESSFQKLLQNDEDYDCRQIQEIYMPKSFDVLPSEQCVNAPHNCEYYPVGYNLAVGKLEHLFSRTDAAKFCNKKQYAERGDYYFYEQHQDFVAYQDSSFATERTDYHIVSVGEIETGDRPQSVKEKLIYERNVRMCEDNVKQGTILYRAMHLMHKDDWEHLRCFGNGPHMCPGDEGAPVLRKFGEGGSGWSSTWCLYAIASHPLGWSDYEGDAEDISCNGLTKCINHKYFVATEAQNMVHCMRFYHKVQLSTGGHFN